MNVAAPALLLLYALLAATWGPRLLHRWRSLDRSPVAAILMWQALSLSALTSVVLAGTAIAVPAIPLTTNVADLLSACTAALRDHYATPGGAITSMVGAVGAGAVASWALWAVGREVWSSSRQRSRQRLAVRLIAKQQDVSGSFIVDSTDAAVYCVPGGDRTVVLTRGALLALDHRQIAAVLAHEDVHIKYRHHLVLMAARGLRRAFPFVALYQSADAELARLIEIHADDAASRCHDRRILAMALVSMAEARSPAGSLGAGGTATVSRVHRLVEPPRPVGRIRYLGLTGTILAMVAVPLVLVILPALNVIAVHYCPLHWAA